MTGKNLRNIFGNFAERKLDLGRWIWGFIKKIVFGTCAFLFKKKKRCNWGFKKMQVAKSRVWQLYYKMELSLCNWGFQKMQVAQLGYQIAGVINY